MLPATNKLVFVLLAFAMACCLFYGCSIGYRTNNVFDEITFNGLREIHESTGAPFHGDYFGDGWYGITLKQQKDDHFANESWQSLYIEASSNSDYSVFEWVDFYYVSDDISIMVVYRSSYRPRTQALTIWQPSFYEVSGRELEGYRKKWDDVALIEDESIVFEKLSDFGLSKEDIDKNRYVPSNYFVSLYLSIMEANGKKLSGDWDDNWGSYQEIVL